MIGALLVSGLVIISVKAEDDEYQYDMDEGKKDESGDGDRIVGGKLSSTKEFSFMVGWNQYGMPRMAACTGSLLTPTYFLSAAHCNGILIDSNREEAENLRKKCVSATEGGGSYPALFPQGGKKMTFKLKCSWIKLKSMPPAFEIISDPPALALVGLDDASTSEAGANEVKVNIKRHIRHKNTYRGGGSYGEFGGYDITLLELAKPVDTKFKPICLPSPKYDDTRQGKDDAIIAGYGRYFRDGGKTCQTNNWGKMKFHYCDKAGGMGAEACKQGPPPQDPACKSFFRDPKTPDNVPIEVEEIRLEGEEEVFCYPKKNPENAEQGWCVTKGNYYRTGDGIRENEKGWGYCGKDCYLDKEAAQSGVIRKKRNIHLLNDKLCDKYLQTALSEEVKFKPKILCVAFENPWKEEVWEKGGSGYRKVAQETAPKITRHGKPFYVASVGTCQGDSGGPVFVQEDDHFVLLGVTSGGRGALGKCGGINNPVHYVRVRAFTRWILEIMGKERSNVCWDSKFRNKVETFRKKRFRRRNRL